MFHYQNCSDTVLGYRMEPAEKRDEGSTRAYPETKQKEPAEAELALKQFVRERPLVLAVVALMLK